MATDCDITDLMSNVIPFPKRPAVPANKDLEVSVVHLEDHCATIGKALLTLAHSVKGQCSILDGIKADASWTWETESSSAVFGDAELYYSCELHIEPGK